MWAVFFLVIALLLVMDLYLFGKKDLSMSSALKLSAFYMSVGVIFGCGIGYTHGLSSMLDYMTGFLVEKSLSLDNIFVISIIFSSLSIPKTYQHRVLFWGILGVIVLRGLMIALGVELLERFEWILYVFAGLMIATGIKLFFVSTASVDMTDNTLIQRLKNYLPLTQTLHGHRFFVRLNDEQNGNKRTFVTPLFLALITIECADLMFAIDSVPAVFAITQDPLIVYTSNIFAILGLRALYSALASMVDRLHAMQYAIAIVLIFIGIKVFMPLLFGIKIPAFVSLCVTILVLAGGVMVSMRTKASSHRKVA